MKKHHVGLFLSLAAIILATLPAIPTKGRAPTYASCFIEVSDASGQPMPGALITFRGPDGKVARSINTTAKGSCIATGLVSGVTYDVTISACGYNKAEMKAAPDANGPLLKLSARLEKAYAQKAASLSKSGDPTGAICGLAVDGSCSPAPDATVILEGGELKEPIKTKSGADGIFDFPALQPASSYRVYATAEGFSTVIRKPIAVKAGETTTMEIQVRP
jgi:hypothetical protein